MPESQNPKWQPPDENSAENDRQKTERQMQNLRRWVESNSSEATAENQDDRPTTPREKRRQRLKQSELEKSRQSPDHPIPEAPQDPVPPPPSPPETVDRPPETKPKKRMAKKNEYQEWLKQDFGSLFDKLGLKDRQIHYLRSRWLDQVLWMEGRAGRARDWHFKLRLTTIIGGVVIPALVSLNFIDNNNADLKRAISFSTFFLSQIVAISAATEQFFNYGDRWRHYRRGVESLKTQGWQFFELSNTYQTFKTHDEAFNMFAAQIEQILQQDVEVYATQVVQKQEAQPKEEPASDAAKVPNLTSTR